MGKKLKEARPGKPEWTRPRKKDTKPESGETSRTERLAEMIPDAVRDPRKCAAPAKIRWVMADFLNLEIPEEMVGKPKLDDNGRPTYRDCNGWSIPGTDRCTSHGGSLPPVRAKAEKLLAESRDTLMNALIELALDETKDDNLRLRAIQWGLERAGFATGIKLDFTIAPWQEMLQKFAGEIEAEEGH